MTHQFYILDVFAESKYAGNQLAVVLDFDRQLSGDRMQAIAREMHYSETTFVQSDCPGENGYDVRIFTPGCEVPFAGHPTIGTAWVIRNKIAADNPDTITLNLKAGQIPVTQTSDADGHLITWLKALQPEFGEVFSPADFASILNLREADFDMRFPIQVVSTGLPFNLVPLATLDAVRRAKMNLPAFEQFLSTHQTAPDVFLFCPEAVEPDNHIHARMFADLFGVAEDPATGSANACFAAYMAKHQYFGTSSVSIRVEQGYEIHRPSRLHLKASVENGIYDIRVGGRCFLSAEGRLV